MKNVAVNQAVQRAIDIVGSQQKLAAACNASQPTVWRWLHGGGIGNRYIRSIVKATNGKVKAHELNPDLLELLKAS